MKVLVINSGSSSVKYELFDMAQRIALAGGVLERIGEADGRLTHSVRTQDGGSESSLIDRAVADHREAMRLIVAALEQSHSLFGEGQLHGIGHRVVHGGEQFHTPTLIDHEVLAAIRQQIPLAPLHNPANLQGIEVAIAECPHTPQVAVFDTAFHQTLPDFAYHYAIPRELYDKFHIRRYGFHGTSHGYVAKQIASYLQRPLESVNSIILHLGNGASAAAIRGGRCVDTSMGLTPLEGLMMGTRSGDIDPAVIFHLANVAGKSIDEIDMLLNKSSGLKGVCGENDMREVLKMAGNGNDQAALATEMFAYRIKKYIGAYLAVLGQVDAIAFTAGIGENSPQIRARACDGLADLGIEIDPKRNSATLRSTREIQAADSRVKVLVVPTDEELEIADQTVRCIAHAQAAKLSTT